MLSVAQGSYPSTVLVGMRELKCCSGLNYKLQICFAKLLT